LPAVARFDGGTQKSVVSYATLDTSAVGTIGWLLIVVSDQRSDGRLGGVLRPLTSVLRSPD
jgi:hypothetical protein